MRWIAMKDALPQCRWKVLAWDDEAEEIRLAEYRECVKGKNGFFYDGEHGFYPVETFTHWAVLPDPPQALP